VVELAVAAHQLAEAAMAGAQDLVDALAQAVVAVVEHLCFLLQAAAIQENQW
jgi:hypothetical protein